MVKNAVILMKNNFYNFSKKKKKKKKKKKTEFLIKIYLIDGACLCISF